MNYVEYEFELWSSTGALIADITGLLTDRKFSEERNKEESFSFKLDTADFEAFAASMNEDPNVLLYPYTTEVLVKRNGIYRKGYVVYDMNLTGNEGGEKIDVKCDGYLNLFKDRYLTKNYDDVDRSAIAWDAINTTQGKTRGDFGVTQGSTITTVASDRQYDRKNIKDLIVELANLRDVDGGQFDFEFSVDVTGGTRTIVFNCFNEIGEDRFDVPLEYPDNILSYGVPRTGVAMFNEINGVGSGFGDEQLSSDAFDVTSQLNLGLHEKPVTFNDVSVQETLDEHVASELDLSKDVIEIPDVAIDPQQIDLSEIAIGDRRIVSISKRRMLQSVNGIYKVEKISVSLDENDAEDINVTFDDYDVTA